VSFDLTHGFRHLAIVGMLSAFMLERIGKGPSANYRIDL
jgi:hypothetical protein